MRQFSTWFTWGSVYVKGGNACNFNKRSRPRSLQKITTNVHVLRNGLVSENNLCSQVIKRVNDYQTKKSGPATCKQFSTS